MKKRVYRRILKPLKSRIKGYIICKECGESFSEDLRGIEKYKTHFRKEHMNQKPIDILNQFARDVGKQPVKHRHRLIFWRYPKNGRLAFAFTPWRLEDGRFHALKYRVYRDGRMKLVKDLVFAKRRVAKARSLKWHKQYYGDQS